jgi:hypothetical protein
MDGDADKARRNDRFITVEFRSCRSGREIDNFYRRNLKIAVRALAWCACGSGILKS